MKMLKNIMVMITTGAFSILGMCLGMLAFKPESITIGSKSKEESK